MNKKKVRHKYNFVLLIFISTAATAIAGDRLPITDILSQAFPVFADFGKTLVEDGYLPAFSESPAPTNISSTPTLIPTPSPKTPTPSPLPAKTATPSPIPTNIDYSINCPGIMPSRLRAGKTVIVMKNLNMRSSPGIAPDNLIRTNTIGTVLEVLGTPVCGEDIETPYLWWQVKTEEGLTGWSTETSASGNFYFLQPLE